MLLKIAGLAAAALALGLSAAPASAQEYPEEDIAGAWEIVLERYDEDTPWGGIVFRDDQTGCMSYHSLYDGARYMAIVFSFNDAGMVLQTPDEDPQELVVHFAGDDILVMASRESLDNGEFDVRVFKRSELFATCGQLRSFVADLEG